MTTPTGPLAPCGHPLSNMRCESCGEYRSDMHGKHFPDGSPDYECGPISCSACATTGLTPEKESHEPDRHDIDQMVRERCRREAELGDGE